MPQHGTGHPASDQANGIAATGFFSHVDGRDVTTGGANGGLGLVDTRLGSGACLVVNDASITPALQPRLGRGLINTQFFVCLVARLGGLWAGVFCRRTRPAGLRRSHTQRQHQGQSSQPFVQGVIFHHQVLLKRFANTNHVREHSALAQHQTSWHGIVPTTLRKS
ncbi:hypothetical protein GALL_505330 [mine drainage metagenome]|uniref:Uncharacterized protein n=1 Tax=mine drainage metagenome TaxID=410659 RepID=A0A1J5P9E3_9ZZZZ